MLSNISSRSSMTASKFGLAALSLGGAHSLEDDDEECEWFPLLSLGTLGMSPDGIPMHSSSAWGLPAPELTTACARGMTASNLFDDEFRDTLLGGSETLVSNVVHHSLKPAKTSSCVCVTHTHTRSFMTFSSLHAPSTVRRAPPRIEIGMTTEHTLSSGRREGGQNSGWAGILTDSSTAGRGGNTTSGTSSKGGAPSFSTEALEHIPQTLDSIVRPMLGAELRAPQEVRRGQQNDDGLYPQRRPSRTPSALRASSTTFMSWEWCLRHRTPSPNFRPAPSTCLPTNLSQPVRPLQVIWSQCPRRTPPTRSVQGAGWELYRYACAQQVFSEQALE